MRSLRKFFVLGLLAVCVTGIIGWSLFRPQTGPTHPLDQMMPEGSLLYIEARDFSGLLKDWSSSPERAEWIKSDDYRVFSNSRLFLRLGQAADQFAAVAGLPPNMKFLADAAGTESAVAVYEIGNLEFLYISRLSSGDFLQSALWQSRNKFQARTAGGKPFFARKDEESGRVVAFAIANNYLILGTREDLVAGSLELMSGSKGRTLSQEGWYTQARAGASPTAGDLRMVMNMEKIAMTPHFRTYWIQQNISEMQSYSSAISDLYREGAVYREERVILPKKQAGEDALAQSAQEVTKLLNAVPKDYGFYQVGPTDAKASLSALEQKILLPRFGAVRTERLAPQVQLTGGQTGAGTDLETHIDLEPASRVNTLNAAEGLQLQLEKASPQALLVVQSTRKNADGILMSIPAVEAIAAANDWDVPSVKKAVQDMVAPALTAARLGLQWREVKDAGGYYELDGLSPVQMAVRGRVLYLANDTGLLTSVLQTKKQPVSQPASYAAAFSHSRERENFYKFSSLVDQPSAREAEPQFFSQNMVSFSRAFAKLDSEEIITRQTKDKIQQTVTYRWMQ